MFYRRKEYREGKEKKSGLNNVFSNPVFKTPALQQPSVINSSIDVKKSTPVSFRNQYK